MTRTMPVDKGTITVKLYSVSEASLVETRMIKTNTEYESLRFNNLKMDTDYRIEFYGAELQRLLRQRKE